VFGDRQSSARSALERFLIESEHETESSLKLSLRQLVRVASKLQRTMEHSTDEEALLALGDLLHANLLSRFMPIPARKRLEEMIDRAGIMTSDRTMDAIPAATVTSASSETRPASTSKENSKLDHLVPDVLFYDHIPSQQVLMQEMEQDFELGEHLLLIGNQGVGKNKVADRFLQRLGHARQYIQLHRDTTVASLTVQQNVVDGKLVSSPSPLVIAAKEGHVLVIDEADKAPTEVVAVLKGLIDGDMLLPDGRRILSQDHLDRLRADSGSFGDCVPIHPNFRMVVLANRPGWPFLGNDFFGECGDFFACHVVDNPDADSEVELLHSYGPNVSLNIIRALAEAFSDLRRKAEEGVLSYPYSTREAVQLIKHLETYPGDTISDALENVFSFDAYDPFLKDHVIESLAKVGFRISRDHFLPSLAARQKVIDSRKNKLTMSYERSASTAKATGPKHGKIDDTNEPHVGGNTWAGGTGGRDTAGMGGKGGPYRLDVGNPIHQISDAEKRNISREIEESARKMGQEELKRRLEQIDMSEYENEAYDRFFNSVTTQVEQLRQILESLQSKSKERVWFRNQGTGDLDEAKLIEGVSGESNIYKRRAEEQDPFHGGPRAPRHGALKKRIRFVFDVSGSMYYFNRADQRLQRLLETAVLVMESFHGFDDKYDYSIVGHSGDSPEIDFVDYGQPPKNRKERLQILQQMMAHSQYCWSGDHTIEAAEKAVKEVVKEEADEYFVCLVSDANLRRYHIDPRELGHLLSADERVQGFAIFIASLWNDAERIRKEMPPGRAFVCLDTASIPSTFNAIMRSSILK